MERPDEVDFWKGDHRVVLEKQVQQWREQQLPGRCDVASKKRKTAQAGGARRNV